MSGETATAVGFGAVARAGSGVSSCDRETGCAGVEAVFVEHTVIAAIIVVGFASVVVVVGSSFVSDMVADR